MRAKSASSSNRKKKSWQSSTLSLTSTRRLKATATAHTAPCTDWKSTRDEMRDPRSKRPQAKPEGDRSHFERQVDLEGSAKACDRDITH
jgi:hypothetical protein